MRGITGLPNLLSSRKANAARRGDAPDGKAHAPKPATRSQTDEVGLAQFALGLARGREAARERVKEIVLPTHSDADEDHIRQAHIGKGQFLVRQELWDELGRMVREADINREITSEGLPVAALLSRGARNDFVQLAKQAFAQGTHPPAEAMRALDEAVDDTPDCWGVAAVAARTHIDVAIASLGPRRPTARPPLESKLMRHHFRRAEEILDPYNAVELGSALLADTRCELLLGATDAEDRVKDEFEDLIDLDPGNPWHMRKFGLRLLPRWFGSFEELDDAAHETAERTEDVWGEGGYTWVWFDVLRAVPETAERLDIDRYLEGMDDILARRGTQYVVNLMAAHAGLVMDPSGAPEGISADAVRNRAAIHGRFGPIIRKHFKELHPRHWAAAQQSPFTSLPSPEALTEDGEAIARSLLARMFRKEIAAGGVVTFSPRGLEITDAA